MGVLKFFRYLSLKYPECLIKLKGTYKDCETSKSKNVIPDVLHYDLNAVFHPVAQDVYGYGAGKKPEHNSLLNRNKNEKNKKLQTPPSEEKLFEEICTRIEDIKRINEPTKGMYFAVDGVAGVSKMSQQRKRRFKGCLDAAKKETNNGFDSNVISTGTEFMERLCLYIDKYIKRQISFSLLWKKKFSIFSGHRIDAEGEHKILNYIREHPEQIHTVISPDADLIFLTAGVYSSTCYIFRENIFDDIDADYFLVDIQALRSCILKEIGLLTGTDTEKEHAIKDFIVYCIFLGNDFLPQIPSININNDAIENLFVLYPKIVKEHGPLTTGLKINTKSMRALFSFLADKEEEMIVKNYRNNRTKYPDTLLKNCIDYDKGRKTHNTCIDFSRYRVDYYDIKLQGVNSAIVVREYLIGLQFVLQYYMDQIPSWEWYYPFHYAPFFTELRDHMNGFDSEYKFSPSEPLSPLEQLLCVLPAKNGDLLPKCMRWLSSDVSSPIIDMFPVDFDTDLEGKKQEYEGVVLLPHIEIKKIRDEFASIKSQLSEIDKGRNIPDKIRIYSAKHKR